MRDNRERSFLEEVFKWFLIWEFISLICRGIAKLFKFALFLLTKLIMLIAFCIGKLTPVVQRGWERFKQNYTVKYKPKIQSKMKELSFMCKKLKYFAIKIYYKYEIQIVLLLVIIIIIIIVKMFSNT